MPVQTLGDPAASCKPKSIPKQTFMRQIITVLAILAGVSATGIQQPLSTVSFEKPDSTGEYQFQWPIQRVAVIGAGPSGIVAYRELTEAGLDVRIFERDSVPGGNWHYTEEIPPDAPVPNAPSPVADFVPWVPPASIDLPHSQEFQDDGELLRDHRMPKPIWESLTSNAASPVQQFPQWPWPAGTQWEVSHYQIRNYVRSYASYLGINSNDENPVIAYNTRVEHIEKRINEAGQEQGWRLWLKSLEPTERHTYKATWWTEDFDAVIVASGKFYAPSMPPIPGLEEWIQRFPELVRHSRQYRRPEEHANQIVLIIGASTSGSEISRDLNLQARQVYQSYRPDSESKAHNRLENYMRRIPKNTTLVGEIKQFLPIPEGSPIQSGLVELKNGTILSGFESVIFATGFRYSFPFLPQYYDGATYAPYEGSAKVVSPFLPLDGSHVRELYLDMFYIQDPTLAFIGMNSGAQIFALLDYLTLALAKVWSNTAKLPSSQAMRELHEKDVEARGGYGKHFLFLGGERLPARIKYLIGWLNEAAVKYGGKQVDGPPKYAAEVLRYWQIVRYGGPIRTMPEVDEGLAGLEPGKEYDTFFNDDDW